jgi:hypothetical protein
MGTDRLEEITRTLLYEGYLLWPYRRSAIKNRRRWTIGGVYPADFEGAAASGDASEILTECLIEGDDAPVIDLRIRCLHRVMRQVARYRDARLEEVDELRVGDEHYLTWDEAVEREARVRVEGGAARAIFPITFPAGREEEWLTGPDGERVGALIRSWEALEGVLDLRIERLAEELGAQPGELGGARAGERPVGQLYRVRARLVNLTSAAGLEREAALGRTFIAAHLVLEAVAGEFVSLLEPPAALAAAASSCRNVGCWPVLVGEPGQRHTILASPVIVYDYPQIAPESPGDLFDGTEIDQLLILNVLGLTEEERAEVRASDPRAREILERSEGLGPEEMIALFGAVREYRELDEDAR